MNYLDVYRQCMQIRLFEKKVESAFELGLMRGTTHGCIGQEIVPVLIMKEIDYETDYITGTHRCHGQVIAYTKDPYRLACEMMGRKDGFVKGLGGSQHIKVENYITNGITGGMVSVGVGIAMGFKKKNKRGMVIAFLGDGGVNEGYVQESMNMSSHFGLPILFVCENNGYAMSTPTDVYSAGNFKNRVTALEIEYREAFTADPEDLEKQISDAVHYVREKGMPCFLDIHTSRLCGHSKSDAMEYMSDEEKRKNQLEDPIVWLSKKLSENEIDTVGLQLSKEIDDIFERANNCAE